MIERVAQKVIKKKNGKVTKRGKQKVVEGRL